MSFEALQLQDSAARLSTQGLVAAPGQGAGSPPGQAGSAPPLASRWLPRGLVWLVVAAAFAPAPAGAASQQRGPQIVAPPTVLPGFSSEAVPEDSPEALPEDGGKATDPEALPKPEEPPPSVGQRSASVPAQPVTPQPTAGDTSKSNPRRPPQHAAPAPAAVSAPAPPAPSPSPPAPAAARPSEARAGLEPPPAPAAPADAAPSTAATGEPCSAFNQLQGLCEASAEAEAPRPWRLFAQSALAWNVIQDEDPANDAGASWLLGGEVDLPLRFDGAFATAFVGLSHVFNPEPDESPVEPLDSLLAVGYRQSVGLDALGLAGRSALLIHRAGAFVPTSRRSRSQGLYAVADWLTAGRFFLGHGTMAGFNLRTQYRFHQYAERAGLEGGLNERWNLQAALLARQTLWSDERFGRLLVQASTGTRYRLRYPSRAGFDSGSSDRAPWFQDWTWGLGAIYVPTPHLNLSLAVGQDTALRQQGFVRADFADRDEFSWTLAVTANF